LLPDKAAIVKLSALPEIPCVLYDAPKRTVNKNGSLVILVETVGWVGIAINASRSELFWLDLTEERGVKSGFVPCIFLKKDICRGLKTLKNLLSFKF
jgi:hypothetical protein